MGVKSKLTCYVYIDYNLCGKTIIDKFIILHGHNFKLNQNEITSQVQTYFNNLFDNHYHLSNHYHTKHKDTHCTELTEDIFSYLLYVRDREWQHVGHEKQFEHVVLC